MIVPGLPNQLGSSGVSIGVRVEADTEDFNLFSEAGSPPGPVNVLLHIDLGVTISSSGIAGPQTTLTVGAFHNDSRIRINNYGTIKGRGGRGGEGSRGDSDRGDAKKFHGGGGGGGAGLVPGLAGQAYILDPGNATDGDPGLDQYPLGGGAAGTNDLDGDFRTYREGSTSFIDGGNGIEGATGSSTYTVELANYGFIWAGGGGGRGGQRDDDVVTGPYAGAEYGEDAVVGGVSGFATSGVTIIIGSGSPAIRGPVI